MTKKKGPPIPVITTHSLRGLVMHMYIHSGYKDGGYDKMSREMRDLYLFVTDRKKTCDECGQTVVYSDDERTQKNPTTSPFPPDAFSETLLENRHPRVVKGVENKHLPPTGVYGSTANPSIGEYQDFINLAEIATALKIEEADNTPCSAAELRTQGDLLREAESSRRYWIDQWCDADAHSRWWESESRRWEERYYHDSVQTCSHKSEHVSTERIQYREGERYHAILNRCCTCRATWLSPIFITGTTIPYTRWRMFRFALRHPVRVWRGL